MVELSLEERANIAYDEANYAKAAELYKELADIALENGHLKAYTDNLYLCGICYCENKEYGEGLNILETVCKYYHIISGGTTREECAVLEAIIDYKKRELSLENNEVTIGILNSSLDTSRSKLLKRYDELNETSRFAELSEDINEFYREMYMLDTDTIHILTHLNESENYRWLSTTPNYKNWFSGIKSLCKWCEIVKTEKNTEIIIALGEHYIDIWEPLLEKLSDEYESWNINDMFFEFYRGADSIGSSLIQIGKYREAVGFLLKCVNIIKPMLLWSNFNEVLLSGYIFYLYARCQKKLGKKLKGEATLTGLIKDLTRLLKIKESTYNGDEENIPDKAGIGVGYSYLGAYYDLEPRDIKSAITAYESAIEYGDYSSAKDLGSLYAEMGLSEKEKSLYENILEKSEDCEIQERLAGIYKDELNYKDAVELYQQLISDADPFQQVQYKHEMYRCMAYLEVDTTETLQFLKEMHRSHLATEGQATLESIKDLRALAYAYVSYANHLKKNGDLTGYDRYRSEAEQIYQKFFEDARPLISETLKTDDIEKLLPYVREYAYVLQGYLELLDRDNIKHLFDLVASYQAFTFEIDRLRSDPSLWQSLQQEDICAAISEHLRNDTAVLNYVLYYRDHRRRYGVFLLKRDTLAFYDLGDASDISKKAAGFLSAVTDFGKELAEVKIHLKDALLNPFSEELEDIKNLYVVRESGLENIPFHFLTEKDTAELISVRSLLRADRKSSDLSHVTVFSDPEYSFEDHEIKPDPYPTLTGSHIEAGLIEDIYKESVDRHSGRDANASRLRQAVKGSGSILHISSHHMRTYEKNSGYMAASKLILAGANNVEMTEEEKMLFGRDGTVSAAELNAQQMQQKLVVLAACQSANGITVEGGGGFGLARAFYTHGCRVVSALYPVGDFASAVFFHFFYQNLKRSKNPDSAIRFARSEMQKTDADKVKNILGRFVPEGSAASGRLKRELRHLGDHPFRHPFFWSGFILGGV